MRRFSICQFSQATRLSIKALRLYADRGLLNPVHIDPESGYRYYASDQLIQAG
ncbi:MAG: MerR family DNA-binding transcriptional regulator [Gammaproteobacteria bacterium]|nr:MerR family DNA-binding transcriptional regulator [Gammaproteobacteria bacterium]